MRTTVLIPVQEISMESFEYHGPALSDNYVFEMHEDDFEKNEAKYKYSYSESDIIIKDRYQNDYSEKTLYDKNGKMEILIIDINPNRLSSDARNDLNAWMGESISILKNETYHDKYGNTVQLNNKEKLRVLPTFTFKIKMYGNRAAVLEDCKMIENYSDYNHPYRIGIMINKITL